MLRIKSKTQLEHLDIHLPTIVKVRMTQLEGTDGRYDPDIHGYLIWYEKEDDPDDFTDVSEGGLMDLLDDDWPGFEYVLRHEEEGRVIYEATVAVDCDKFIAIFIEDADWLHPDLREMLKRESEPYMQTEQGEIL
jgi:hypothetical protein